MGVRMRGRRRRRRVRVGARAMRSLEGRLAGKSGGPWPAATCAHSTRPVRHRQGVGAACSGRVRCDPLYDMRRMLVVFLAGVAALGLAGCGGGGSSKSSSPDHHATAVGRQRLDRGTLSPRISSASAARREREEGRGREEVGWPGRRAQEGSAFQGRVPPAGTC